MISYENLLYEKSTNNITSSYEKLLYEKSTNDFTSSYEILLYEKNTKRACSRSQTNLENETQIILSNFKSELSPKLLKKIGTIIKHDETTKKTETNK
jgi:hypothetical protein